MSIKKANILLREAESDLLAGNYNKSASASYFAARMVVDMFLRHKNLLIPRRDDKLANLFENQGFKGLSDNLRKLYDIRKKADYLGESVNSNEARRSLEMAKEIFNSLLDKLSSNEENYSEA